MNLSAKLVTICVLFGAAPIVALELIDSRAFQRVLEEQASDYEVMARDASELIDRNLFERYGDVQAFAVNAAVDNYSEWYKPNERDNAVVRAMNDYVSLYGVYPLMMMVDTEGKVVATNSRDAAGKPIDTSKLYGQNFKEAPWFKAAAAGQFTTRQRYTSDANAKLTGTFIEDVAVDPLITAALGTSVQTVSFTAPVRVGGKIIGYWTNRADFAMFESFLLQIQRESPDPVQIDLYSSTGVLMASVDQDDGIHGVPVTIGANAAQAGNKAVQELLAGKSGVVFWDDGVHPERAHGYAISDGALGFAGLGWGVDVSLETSVAGATVIESQRKGLIAAGVLLALIAAIAFFIGRRISAPIVDMAAIAGKLAEGDVEQSIAHTGADEIGQLADGFRSMTQYVKDASEKIASVGAGQARIEVTPRSDKDALSKGLAQASTQVSYLVDQVMGAAFAAERGDLSARVAVGTLQGDYAELANTINRMLESMIAPSVAATAALERVAACDLTAKVEGEFVGDHARLKNALNTAVASVRDALLQVSRGSEQVQAASSQIASGSQTLASGASEQAASLTQTRAVLESVAQMTGRNAENAQHANALSLAARESSSRGAGAMEHMTQAVTKIRAAVENTAQIIRDINQIAFQTNLLALNAAVEAARAGDAGRGFAVVADEVRNLAQQAKGAAHKTEELLQDSIRQAERGEALTQDVTKNLSEIVGSVKKVGEIIEEIAGASREQASGIEQVNKASGEMDQVTHQNAASSEELSSTAEELAAQAQELSSMVSRFRLGDEREARRAAPARDSALRRPRLESSVGPAIPVTNGTHLIPFEDDAELRDF